MITLNVNGKRRDLDIPDDMPLLWTLRDVLSMTGTKFGCGIGPVPGMHHSHQRTADAVLHHAGFGRSRKADHHHRSHQCHLRGQESPGGLARVGRAAVRLLPIRPDHVGKRAARR